MAEERIAYLQSLPEPLLNVASLIHQDRLQAADRQCRHFLKSHKQHLEGIRLLASIADKLGMLPDAEFLLDTAVELEPDHAGAGCDRTELLLKMQKFEQALEQADKLTRLQPDNPLFQSLLANALAGAGRHQEAIAVYDQVIGAHQGQHRLHVMRGHAQKTIGRLSAAIRSYRAAYGLQPDYGDAFWSLANIKTYRFTTEEVTLMQQMVKNRDMGTQDLVHLHFALGKVLEDTGEYETAFFHYDEGNSLQRKASNYRLSNLEHRVKAQIQVCTRGLLEKRHSVGSDAPDPIFIVGLPRAGSTLLEQILASHSQVDGTMELPHIHALAQRLKTGVSQVGEDEWLRYPAILADLDASYYKRLADQFLEQTRIYRGTAPFFIDKNPNNFFHLGLIKLMLPNARIIDARRHPLACCFSGFKQLFGQGQEFTYGLERIGHYYRQYLHLMAHWDSVLPGEILLVEHEQVVADLETQVRRLLDFCRLPYEEQCLAYHETRRSIRTPSSEQVRQPIYTSGLEAWKPFSPWLQPLVDALGEDTCRQYGIPDPLR